MRRLLFITQQVDPDHPALAATVPKIHALAARVDELVVLAAGVVPSALPDNARAHSFAARSRAARFARFERALLREAVPKPMAIVAHMCPIYAVLAVPVARPLGIPVALWFTHWKRSRTLVLADRLATHAFSVDRRTYPIRSRKLRAIGHGIDVDAFTCGADRRDAGGLHAMGLGRTSPSKGLETVIDAVAIARGRGLDVTYDLYGPSLTDEERAHREQLRRRARELDGAVRIHEAVPHEQVAELFSRADCLVNNMREGATDKVVYEAAASCLPVLASNSAFDALLDGLSLDFPRDDADALAARLQGLSAREDREWVGGTLRERVVAGHSADAWAEKLLAGLT